MKTLKVRDVELERMWDELTDVPFDENENGELILAEKWEHFDAGTSREDIWKWFDERYSKGVAALLYGDGTDHTPDMATLAYRRSLCFECDYGNCVYNPEGVCLYPLISGKSASEFIERYLHFAEWGECTACCPIKGVE